MNDMSVRLQVFTKFITYFVILCAVAWLILPDYRIYAAGFIIGSLVSYLNSYYLSMKIRQLAQAVTSKSSKRINLGFLTRASIAVLAAMWALVSDQIHVGTTIAGMLFTPLVVILLGIQSIFKRNNNH
jgi:ATP synthase protein I